MGVKGVFEIKRDWWCLRREALRFCRPCKLTLTPMKRASSSSCLRGLSDVWKWSIFLALFCSCYILNFLFFYFLSIVQVLGIFSSLFLLYFYHFGFFLPLVLQLLKLLRSNSTSGGIRFQLDSPWATTTTIVNAILRHYYNWKIFDNSFWLDAVFICY